MSGEANVRVILEDPDRYWGMDHADAARGSGPRPRAFCKYDEIKAWPTGLNVYEVPAEQYERWKAAEKAYQAMQAEIRDLIRQRQGY